MSRFTVISSEARNPVPVLKLAAVLLLLLTTACAPPQNTIADARQLFNQYYTAIGAGDYQAAARLYPPEVQLKWQDFLEQQATKKGAQKSYTLENVEENTVYSGKYYLLTVHTENENYAATETVTLFKKLDEEKMRVVSHKIKPVQR